MSVSLNVSLHMGSSLLSLRFRVWRGEGPRSEVEQAGRALQPLGIGPAGNAAPTADPMARGQTECTGLGSRIAHPGGYRQTIRLSAAPALDHQRLLGRARIRNSRARRGAGILETMRRYFSQF